MTRFMPAMPSFELGFRVHVGRPRPAPSYCMKGGRKEGRKEEISDPIPALKAEGREKCLHLHRCA